MSSESLIVLLRQAINALETEGSHPWNIGFALLALCEWALEQETNSEKGRK